ncbi:DUF1992 domain-containing protein [Microbacterium sp. gxy059]|uniref:DnaJ family domain-containing protein n=1 Tax=Microbacterium sp. gxy059 TaxID=2957199 RepID=UPI003D963608
MDDARTERSGETRDASGPPRWSTPEERAAVVEQAIQTAIRRGDFDDLPGAGKPLPDLDKPLDPDWWIRRKIETENLTGLAPPAIQLRTEHREMERTLDELPREEDVRAHLDDFNRRVRRARMQLEGGPPVVTPTRAVEAEVAAWRERRAARPEAEQASAPRRRWWRRGA